MSDFNTASGIDDAISDEDEALPGEKTLTAMSPMMPGNLKQSTESILQCNHINLRLTNYLKTVLCTHMANWTMQTYRAYNIQCLHLLETTRYCPNTQWT